MGTELTTGHYGQSLKPQERDRHRAWIGVRIEALLYGYWHSSPPPHLVKVEIVKDWMSVLEWFSEDEITAACRKWVTDCPRIKPQPRQPEPERALTAEEMERRRKVAAEVLKTFTEGRSAG